jgi:hypothetical protein
MLDEDMTGYVAGYTSQTRLPEFRRIADNTDVSLTNSTREIITIH